MNEKCRDCPFSLVDVPCTNSPACQVQGPGVVSKVWNFTQAVSRRVVAAVSGEEIDVEPVVQEYRLAICRTCDHLDRSLEECLVCGCPVAEKTKWSTEECPVGKWPTARKAASGSQEASVKGGCGCGGV